MRETEKFYGGEGPAQASHMSTLATSLALLDFNYFETGLDQRKRGQRQTEATLFLEIKYCIIGQRLTRKLRVVAGQQGPHKKYTHSFTAKSVMMLWLPQHPS
eukprot:6186013-Pleurochrysis_carterae.AAC.1